MFLLSFGSASTAPKVLLGRVKFILQRSTVYYNTNPPNNLIIIARLKIASLRCTQLQSLTITQLQSLTITQLQSLTITQLQSLTITQL